jgi:hypothetical protein
MPLVIFILIVLLIAQVGFWTTLGAIVGAVAMIVLLIVLAAAILVLAGFWLFTRMTRDSRQEPDSWS